MNFLLLIQIICAQIDAYDFNERAMNERLLNSVSLTHFILTFSIARVRVGQPTADATAKLV